MYRWKIHILWIKFKRWNKSCFWYLNFLFVVFTKVFFYLNFMLGWNWCLCIVRSHLGFFLRQSCLEKVERVYVVKLDAFGELKTRLWAYPFWSPRGVNSPLSPGLKQIAKRWEKCHVKSEIILVRLCAMQKLLSPILLKKLYYRRVLSCLMIMRHLN